MKTLIKKMLGHSSISLAVIYTFGHILIAILTVKFMTDASWFDAGSVALVEPCINGVWFYILHSLWRRYAN